MNPIVNAVANRLSLRTPQRQSLVTLIHTQMQDHFEDKADAYVATATSGFTTLPIINHWRVL